MSLRVIITGGGTGGHIYPGISLAHELISRDFKNEILFVGTQKGLETKLIPREGFKFCSIKAKGLSRKICGDNFTAIGVFFISLWQAYKLIRKFKPDVVIGTGGYVSGSVVLIAALLKIPTFVHEQNVFPGVTNRFLSRIVKAVFLSFDQSRRYFKGHSKLVFSGNPVRCKNLPSLNKEDFQRFRLDPSKKTILAFGGSKGAASINRAVIEGVNSIKEDFVKNQWQVLLITGSEDYEEVRKIMIDKENSILLIEPYLYDMERAYALADLVICRAGATSIAEISAYGLPAILIPYPLATHNHQEYNARLLEKEGAALMVLDKDLSGERLAKILLNLMQDERQLERMSQKVREFSKPDSAKKIVDFIFDYVKKK